MTDHQAQVGAAREECMRLSDALAGMLHHFGKPRRDEWINDEAFKQAQEAEALARAVLSASPSAPARLTDKRIIDLTTNLFPDWQQDIQKKFVLLLARAVEAEVLASPAPPASEPVAGWKLIPIEPPDCMMDCFAGTKYSELPVGKRINERKAYQAMLAATPQPPAASEPVGHHMPSEPVQEPIYLIFFDDQDVRPEILTSGAAARERFRRVSDQWNAHLFVKVQSNTRDDPTYSRNAPQPPAASSDALDAARHRFWRKFYRSMFAISGRYQLKFMPSRPQVEIAGPEYEQAVDAALDAAMKEST